MEGWRHPSTEVASYLIQLEAWGYKLSPVERVAVGYPETEPEGDTTTDDASATDAGTDGDETPVPEGTK